MKRLSLLLIVIVIFISFNKEETYKIPDDSIRLRVLANSNSNYDQQVKFKVSNKIQSTMYDLLKDTKGIDNARFKISNNLNIIEKDVKKVLKEENYPLDYKINFGYNYFPEKEYKGIKYEAGEYESVLVTLGRGEGNNWWCVLFPPLCVLEVEENEKENVEYKSFISELIKKYL